MTARRRLVAVGAVALAARLVLALVIHPPFSFVKSDAAGYIFRAQDLLAGDFSADPAVTFFPYGTHFPVSYTHLRAHFLLAAVLGAFGGAEWSVGLVWALFGTAAVVFSLLSAEELIGDRPRAVLVVGLVLALYPPWVAHTGFALSETPTTCAIAAAAWFGLRLAKRGRWHDALGVGVAIALGTTLRPQLLVSVVFLAIAFLWRRRELKGLSWKSAVAVALPIALVLGFSAERIRYHTGERGLVSTNGAFNLALGRCHAHTLIAARSDNSTFRPPSFLRLWRFREQSGVDPIPALDPAITPELSFDGKLWEQAPARALAKRCVAETGPWRQVKYSLSHVFLLWAYNVPWPTKGPIAMATSIAHPIVLVPGLVLALLASLRRRHALALTLSAHIFALFAVAAIFFGEARLRMPYDGIIVLLAVWAYGDLWQEVKARGERVRAPQARDLYDASSLTRR